MGPRTGQGDIKVITTGLGRKAADTRRSRLAVGRDPVTALRLFALKRAVLAAFVPLVLPAALD